MDYTKSVMQKQILKKNVSASPEQLMQLVNDYEKIRNNQSFWKRIKQFLTMKSKQAIQTQRADLVIDNLVKKKNQQAVRWSNTMTTLQSSDIQNLQKLILIVQILKAMAFAEKKQKKREELKKTVLGTGTAEILVYISMLEHLYDLLNTRSPPLPAELTWTNERIILLAKKLEVILKNIMKQVQTDPSSTNINDKLTILRSIGSRYPDIRNFIDKRDHLTVV